MSDICKGCGCVYKNYAGLVLHEYNCVAALKIKLSKAEKEIKQLKAERDGMRELLIEMDIYLDKGNGTNIGCGSVFHREIKALSALPEGESDGLLG